MKKILIIARNVGVTDLVMAYRIDCLFSEREMAHDVDAVAKGIEESGYEAVVFAPREHADTEFYAYYGRFIERARILRTEEELKEELSEIVAAVLVGIPAKAGTEKAFMDMTYAPDWVDYYIDGEKKGECAIYTKFLAMNGIPVIGFVGDKSACVEAQEEIANLPVVITKEGKNHFNAKETKKAELLREEMTNMAKCAAQSFRKAESVQSVTVEIEFMREDGLEDFLYVRSTSGFTRTGARRLQKRIDATNSLKEFLGVL